MKFSCSNMNFFLDLFSKESCSCPNIKKILMFPKTGPYTFDPKPKKTEKKKKKKHPKKSLIFLEMEFSSPNIKKILIFSYFFRN